MNDNHFDCGCNTCRMDILKMISAIITLTPEQYRRALEAGDLRIDA
jgi:hypothetical protein